MYSYISFFSYFLSLLIVFNGSLIKLNTTYILIRSVADPDLYHSWSPDPKNIFSALGFIDRERNRERGDTHIQIYREKERDTHTDI